MKQNRQHAQTIWWAAVVGMGLLVMMSRLATTAPLTLSGTVSNSGSSYTIADLQSQFGSTTFTLGADQFTGVSLWTFLGGNPAGTMSNVITSTPAGANTNNPPLRYAVRATGSDGAQSLFSLGEITPRFGGTGAQPDLIAYMKNGMTLSTPELIMPQDSSGSRAIANLVHLDVFGAPAAPNAPPTQSSQFTLSGHVMTPGTYDLTTLEAFTPTIVSNVTFTGGSGLTPPNEYTGVRLWDLLTDAGLSSDILSSYLVATATDGYRLLVSLAELNPAFSPRAFNYLVAYDDQNNDLLPGTAGFARLIFPGDNRGGRYLSNVTSLEVVATVPEPGTMALCLSGLVAMALLTRHHRSRRCLARPGGADEMPHEA